MAPPFCCANGLWIVVLPTDTPLPPSGDKGPWLVEFALAVAVPPEGVLRVRRPGIEEGERSILMEEEES